MSESFNMNMNVDWEVSLDRQIAKVASHLDDDGPGYFCERRPYTVDLDHSEHTDQPPCREFCNVSVKLKTSRPEMTIPAAVRFG